LNQGIQYQRPAVSLLFVSQASRTQATQDSYFNGNQKRGEVYMSIFGRNAMQARINSLQAKGIENPNSILKTALAIQQTGVGSVPVNRAQRRHEQKKQRKNK